ncbi:DUF4097 family beta strand repeat-containing protein [Streptomyces seoulensis]|uniref:DUF4097 family beta strand repeat-containing protein n=1 Tax=Streptomyces seoulensis TaxID=73044 RepID=UPI001FCDBDE2|nr:DUF4097 family beta strand repeat-containing protein [Streptomyces seoulensis]BDH08735.1 lipoprotein [Streptomyces seoulensis]
MHAKPTRTLPGRRLLMALGAAVLVGGALGGCAVQDKSSTSQYGVDAKVSALSVTTKGGDIDVLAGDGPGARVTEKIRYAHDKPRTEHSVSDGRLTLTAPSCDDCGVSYTVSVPPGATLTLDTEGGNITVRNVDGDMKARTGGGNVHVTDAAPKNLSARTDGGNIEAALTRPPSALDAETGGGNVTVSLPRTPYTVKATTDGGRSDISVPTDPSSPHHVTIRTGGGNIKVGVA